MIKKGVILTLLTSFVFLMNFQISYADDVKIVREIDGLSVTEDGSYKVKYNETKPILLKQNDYVKLNIKKDKEVVILLDGSEIETPPGKLPQSPFKYALFAGAEEINGNKDVLILRGDQLSISGYSHSNGNIIGGIGRGSAVCKSEEDKLVVNRARRLQRFFTQPFFAAESFTGIPGVFVPLQETLRGIETIINGHSDEWPEQAFYMVGTIDQAEAKARELLKK